MEAEVQSQKKSKAILVLEDGTYIFGRGFGATEKVSGEVVFSTSMVGYPEALTDPSYQGQILAFTYPLIGNYGVPSYENREFDLPLHFESESIKVTGLIVHELCEKPHHWASDKTLDDWLYSEGIPGIHGIDTRELTKKLRTHGVMLGILQVYEEGEEPKVEELLKEAKAIPDPNSRDLVREVSIKEPKFYEIGGKARLALIDCGAKNGIIRNLLKRGIDIVKVPYHFSAEEIMEYHPKGVIISNGPGDPKNCDRTIECVRDLFDEKIPLMGICLGNQILALALGGDTYKLKYGHRSQNQPVLDFQTDRCYITAQNHGYTVNPRTLDKNELRVRFLNANDKTVEGIECKGEPILGFQWHPEAAPGPNDTDFLFDEFLRIMRR